MNIIVVGMGETGRHITGVLVDEGHNVTVVDASAEALARAEDAYDILTLRGHAASPRIQEQLDLASCDLFVAVTDKSEVNLIAALSAARGGAKRTAARADDPAYFVDDRGVVTDMLGIDLVINPKALVARELHRMVRSISALSVEDFADNRVEVVQLPIDKSTKGLGTPLRTLELPQGALIVALVRDGALIVPAGDDYLQIGDEAYVVGLAEAMSEVERVFGRPREGLDVVLIERDRDRCRELAKALHRTVILNGDGTDVHLLEEEGVDKADVFIAASNADEVNLMASLLAKELGSGRCLAVVHKPDYASVCERLGIDVTISPRIAVAKQVLKYVHEGQVISTRQILDGAGEFLEFVVSPDARAAGVPLRDLNFPRGAIVCAGLGRDGTFVAHGDTKLSPGDRVVVFTLPKQRGDVERLFRKPLFAKR
jgi:trk system potassium uptake protein TrkA